MTQADLADLVRTRQATISLLERGQMRRVELDLVERIAKALKVPASSLFVDLPPSGKTRG